MADPAVLVLERSLADPATAREFVRTHLAGHSADTRHNAALLVSELVTNVVRHGTLPARVELVLLPGGLRVAVIDSAAALPVMTGNRTDAEQGTGRGLIIVAAVARSWGVEPMADGAGKSVWFELDAVPSKGVGESSMSPSR